VILFTRPSNGLIYSPSLPGGHCWQGGSSVAGGHTLSRQWRFPGLCSTYQGVLPQIGLVFLIAGIGKGDIILLGVLSTPAGNGGIWLGIRAYEFSPALLVLAPLI